MGKHSTIFNQIYKDGDDIIKKRGYVEIHFYGIAFCYLSNYDKNFLEIIKKCLEGKTEIIYEVLITYYLNFKNNPLNQDKEF